MRAQYTAKDVLEVYLFWVILEEWSIIYLYDGLGTVRALADENGTITDSYTYDAFGNLLNVQSSGPATPNFYLYTGEQYDADLGMYFLRARYNDTDKGRLHNMDTFEGRKMNPKSLHKYLYVYANPVIGIDPSGNDTLVSISKAMAIVGLAARFAIASYSPPAMAERAATAMRMQAYTLTLVLRYVTGMRLAIEEFLSSVISKATNAGNFMSTAIGIAVGEVIGLLNTDQIIKDYMKQTPIAVAKAVALGPLGKFSTLIGVALNIWGFLNGKTTSVINTLSKAAIGATFAFGDKKKSVFFLMAASLGQFYPELIIYRMQRSVEARMDGNQAASAYWKDRAISYANLFWDVK